jgi:hypothetical protein
MIPIPIKLFIPQMFNYKSQNDHENRLGLKRSMKRCQTSNRPSRIFLLGIKFSPMSMYSSLAVVKGCHVAVMRLSIVGVGLLLNSASD